MKCWRISGVLLHDEGGLPSLYSPSHRPDKTPWLSQLLPWEKVKIDVYMSIKNVNVAEKLFSCNQHSYLRRDQPRDSCSRVPCLCLGVFQKIQGCKQTNFFKLNKTRSNVIGIRSEKAKLKFIKNLLNQKKLFKLFEHTVFSYLSKIPF